jgi:hypothetical protein
MEKNYLKVGLSVGAAMLCASAYADQSATSGITPIQNPAVFTFSSFGTIGVVETNTNNGVYTTGQQVNGATKTADFGPDTKAGAQMDVKFNDDFSATVQVFSKQNAVGSYEPDVEWAFGKLKLGGGFELRLGRIGAPFFMTSDFRSVGYTNTSLRTPVDVYGLVPVRSFDGGDLLYRADIGSTTVNGQLWLGKSKISIGENEQGPEYLTLNNIAGLNVSAETGPLTLRVGTMKTRLSTSGGGLDGFNTLLGTLNEISAAPGLGSLATMSDDLAINGKFASFTGVGAVLDQGNWIASSEVVKRTTGSTYIPTITAWYATLGYRIDVFTPYVSFSGRHTNSATSVTSPTVAPYLPAQIQGAVPVLVGTVNSLLGKSDETTGALGVRWDVGKNYDIKAEFQQIRIPAGSAGIFSDVQGGFYSVETHVNVFSLAVDFVF